MHNFLEGFEKRMEIIGIVESIVNRKNRNMELERLFNDNDFINLVFSVLLYIMEKTLSEDSDCDSEHIANFIESILKKYYNINIDKTKITQLTSYIIKNVLQNEGVPYYFQAINYSSNTKRNITIRLITDRVLEINGSHKINYSLTDQGYDFLFRTKEVDQEIKMTIEELKLRELIKRKNFKKAHEQSLELIQMVRQKKKEIQNFIAKIKENIHDAHIDEYEKLINSTYDLLNEEYDLLIEIMDMSKKSEDKIKQEYELSKNLDESLKKAQSEIKMINNNIKTVLSEQKDLILNRQSLSKVYIDIIGDSFIYSMENRFDIEEVILRQMEQHVEMAERFWMLVNPIFLPNVYKNLNLQSIYEPQGMIKIDEEEKVNYIEEDNLEEDREKEKIQRVNHLYIEILNYIIKHSYDNNGVITLKDIIDSLIEGNLLNEYIADRLLFTTLLKLYDIGIIDIERWKQSKSQVILNPSEEFNLEYCLYELLDKYEYINEIKKIKLFKDDSDLVEVEVKRKVTDGLSVVEKIEISNFIIRVV